MENQTTTINQETFSILKKIGCCLRCRMRFSGVFDDESYADPANYFNKLLSTNIPYEDVDVCVSCLGLLQNNVLKNFLNTIVVHIP